MSHVEHSELQPITWSSKKLPLSELQDYDKNPRRIKKKDFEKLCAFLKDDGYVNRIIVDANNIIVGGHQRKRAMLAIGYKPTDIIEVLAPSRALTEHEFDRINIRNNIGIGEYDFDILANNFSIEELTAFGLEDLDSLMPTTVEEGLTDADSVPDMPTEPRSKLGDVWLCGEHRVVCGDSTDPLVVDKAMGGNNPILMVTDPPYGVNYDPEWRDKSLLGAGNRSLGKVENDHQVNWTDTYSLFTGDVAYVWHSEKYVHKVAQHLEDCGYKIINLIVWNKSNFVISRGDYHRKHETCWYIVKNDKTHNWQGARDQSTVWGIPNLGEEKLGHSTQKPIECMERPILNNSKKGEYIYDPFGGSGTTLIACEKNGRTCLTIELSEKYVDIIVSRWQKFTGKKATLEETGEAFD